MGSVFYRNPKHDYPFAVSGEGVYLKDAEGKQYLDGSGGAAVSCLGHGHPKVIEAIQKQTQSMAYAHTAFFTSEPQEKLAAALSERFGEASKVYFLSGGSEANETAIKLARAVLALHRQIREARRYQPQAELPRQHHRCAFSHWPSETARTL